VRGAQVIATSRLSPPRRSPATYLVTTADAAVLESVFASVADAGWRVKSVVSAYSAWEAGARRLWPELVRAAGGVSVSCGDKIEVLQLEAGRLSMVRRFAAWAAPSAADLSRAITSSQLAAARSCEHAAGPELLPDCVRLERRRSTGRLSAKLLAASAALLVLTAGIEAWGAGRELGAVQRRRAALEENVARAMQVRDEMSQLDARLGILADAEASRSQWARTLVSIAEHLPIDAHLVGFRGSADSLVLEGEAERAGLVFESLQKAPGVLAVRADAPIRQEARDSGPAVERFTLAARLAPR
jgi:hypothetical protein